MYKKAVKIKFIIFMIVFVCLNAFLLASCSSKDKSQYTASVSKPGTSITGSATTVAPTSTPLPASQGHDQEPKPTERVVKSFEEYHSARLPLIAAIPDRDIYLYGIKSGGVVLCVGDNGVYYKWESYLTPQFVLPSMYVNDYDNDGKDELAVILYLGSGTGVSLEKLHIVEISEYGYQPDEASNSSTECFKDYFYSPDTYLLELKKSIKLNILNDKDKLIAKVTINDKVYNASTEELQLPGMGKIYDRAVFGNIVRFSCDGGRLSAGFALGVSGECPGPPCEIGNIRADVNYKAGKFSLSNIEFEALE